MIEVAAPPAQRDDRRRHQHKGALLMASEVTSRSNARPAASLVAVALGAAAVGAVAIGALAIGRLAINRLAINRLTVRKAQFGTLEVDDLTVRRLRVVEPQGPKP
jgi:hypothetical protein